eukprot:CAMPEP_0174302770 /NCGR_PEP_ID=MMETSP0809-20121228/59802_1 /TAXON_ID=73025 ORGANISM="Eutreptiella gymnastica-like, Strain CCMP1594" /NCGR_SAMPLE_ID=MMETSP0809 /ASSEMBLY_ACC=CAM_ASM_000658 /LENGTH=297 /DNA_ID=CAMNT_0015408699 /DNA_START=93 /DNA_END=986 /DNA_ORIENTATION=-
MVCQLKGKRMHSTAEVEAEFLNKPDTCHSVVRSNELGIQRAPANSKKSYEQTVPSSPAKSVTIGGLQTDHIRQLVGGPRPQAPVPKERMPAYLRVQHFRPTRGCYSDEFVRRHYIRPDTPQDPFNYGGRTFTYMVTLPLWAACVASARVVTIFCLDQFRPTKEESAHSNLEVDLGDVPEGTTIALTWKGQPIHVRHRTAAEIEESRSVALSQLRDPATDEERVPHPEWAVFIATCTHLGCVTMADAGQYGAYFCPCHCAVFDHAGRIRSGPAPRNLDLVPYRMVSDTVMYIGDLAEC